MKNRYLKNRVEILNQSLMGIKVEEVNSKVGTTYKEFDKF